LEARRAKYEAEAVRREAQTRIADLRGRLSASEHRAENAERRGEGERQRYEHELARMQTAHATQISETVRSRQHDFQKDAELARSNAAAVRHAFGSLEVSAVRYAELKAMDQDTMPLKEWLQLRVHETVGGAKRLLENARQDSESMRSSLAAAQQQVERATRTNVEETSVIKARNETLESRATAAESANKQLKAAAESARAQYETVMERGVVYEKTLRQLEEAERDVKRLREENAKMLPVVSDAKSERTFNEHHAQQAELLRQDKEYLTHEVETLKERLARSDEQLQFAERERSDLKDQKADLYSKMLSLREEFGGAIDRKVQDELQRLSEKSALEMAAAQRQARDMYETETRALREGRDTAQDELVRLRSQLEHLQRSHDEIDVELRSLQATTEAQASELRSGLKMKAFDVERLTSALEDTRTSLKQVMLESEKYRDKYELVREEYYVLKADKEARVAELTARLTAASDKLQQYDVMEAHVDDAVFDAAEEAVDGGPDGARAESRIMLEALGSTLPTATKRRMEQSVALARRVVELQRENQELQKQLDSAGNAAQSLQAQVSAKDAKLDSVNQPYNFLVKNLESKEGELASARKLANEANERALRAEAKATAALAERQEMQRDLARLLKQRAAVQALKQDVMGLVHTTGSESLALGFNDAPTKDVVPGMDAQPTKLWFKSIK